MYRLKIKIDNLNLYNAGLPEFTRNFTRDSIISALIMQNAEMLRGQLIFCEKKQGQNKNPLNGEEQGKIFHDYPPYAKGNMTSEYNACDTTALFLIGSRSELLGVLLVFPILVIYQIVEQPKVTVLILIVTFTALSAFVFINYDNLSVRRQKEIINLSESTSFQRRIEINKEVLEVIKKNPIVGDFSGHAYSGAGHYAHNFLSSWRQLGLFGFLLYSTLLFWPVIGTFHMIIRNPNLFQVDIWRVSSVISAYVLLLALVAKSIFSPVFALSWGIYIATIRMNTLNLMTSKHEFGR